MKKLLVVLLTCLASSQAYALEPDKAAHAAVSFGLAYAGADVLEKLGLKPAHAEVGALVLALAVGFAKEATDPTASSGDIAANLAGALTGFALHWTLRF